MGKLRSHSKKLGLSDCFYKRAWILGMTGLSLLVVAWVSIHPYILGVDSDSSIISEADGMELVFVPEGEFMMGSENWSDDEKPAHTVYLDAFWIDKTEVTNAMYRLCVDDEECNHPQTLIFFDDKTYDDHPVVAVTWQDAVNYCTWAGRQLPTEAQWEKAARGTDGREYAWGNTWDSAFLNWTESRDLYRSTSPVGSFEDGASPYGALDMQGNVWEWVADWYAGDFYDHSPKEKPSGPESGFERVHRGGSWYDIDFNQRTSNRDRNTPHFPDLGIGFRCVLLP